ncbi:transglycosylase domain-containing protein [Nocardia jiangsuensis]|uniref:Transglycosylase domain-containing protein n=1 Tax=Nocardia jiangsuensis TaxID=1691563 RepID=A0ABV8DU80_9NOCA
MSSSEEPPAPRSTPRPVYDETAHWKPLPGPGAAGRAGNTPPGAPVRPHRTRGQRLRRLLLALTVVFVAVPALLFVLVYWSAEIPSPENAQGARTATVLAADGSTVLTTVVPPNGNRTPTPLADVPVPVRQAVLAAEDRDFYSNPGYSTSGFLRAVRDNLLGHDNAGGGSTITQQYVKNAFLGHDRTVTRKLRELVIAAKMARQWSKDDILAAYLNTIYYGRGAYGIAAAATNYFGKPVPELTTAEGAVLAAVIRSPSILTPETHLPQLRDRWRYVLDGMVELGTLTAAERDATAFPNIIPVTDIPDTSTALGPEGLLRTRVLRELADSGIDEHQLNTGALQITTTIDARAQQAALDAVTSRLGPQPPQLRGAVVSVDPRSGAVRAYYGGADGTGYDFAAAPLQTGSAFKVFAAIAAQQQAIPLTRTFDSGPVTDRNATITNVGGESCGKCSLAEALKRSLNTVYYRLTMSMSDGPGSIADAAHLAGIPEELPGVGKTLTENGAPPYNGIVLGQYLVRPIDMASAYATLAAGGVYHPPYFVQKVVTGGGEVLLDRGDPGRGEQRISRAIADNTVRAMLPVAGYSNNHGLAGGRPSAAKTGTTQLGETAANKDAWMIGFTPALATAVWIGTDLPQPLRTARGGDIYGSGLPADIWKDTMDGALDGTPVEQFPAAAAPQPTAPGGGFGIFGPETGTAPSPTPAEPFIVIPPATSGPAEPGELFPGLSGR